LNSCIKPITCPGRDFERSVVQFVEAAFFEGQCRFQFSRFVFLSDIIVVAEVYLIRLCKVSKFLSIPTLIFVISPRAFYYLNLALAKHGEK